MKELDINIAGAVYLDNANVYVDGRPAKFRKNQYKNLTYHHRTDQDTVKIRICKYADIGGAVWFFIQLLFFVISIFGIFDTRIANRAVCFDCTLDVDIKGNDSLTLRCNPPKNGQKVFDVDTGARVQEHDNCYCTAENAEKKLKALKLAKILLAVAIVVIVTVTLIVTLA